MAKNQALTFKSLKDVLYTQEELIKSVERINIFEMKDKEDKSLGFISSFDLKSYIVEQGDNTGDYSVKNIDSNQWVSIFTHPSFQRRKPQIVNTMNFDPISDQQFFILKEGQKDGPYEKTILFEMLEQKEILLTDMVSTNGGHTWIKLFHVDKFERRVLKESDQLPGIPDQAVGGNSDSVAPSIPSTDAISSLAYLSNVKRGQNAEKDKSENYILESKRQNNSNIIYKWLLVASIIGIALFVLLIKNQLTSPFKNNEKTIGEQAEMLVPVEMNDVSPPTKSIKNPVARPTKKTVEKKNVNQINDTQRNRGKFEARELQPIRPIQPVSKKSFMDTSDYQNIQIGTEQEDPNYFYDNTSPMELDPVRSQVSKENYDNSAVEGEGPIPPSDNLFENEIPSTPY